MRITSLILASIVAVSTALSAVETSSFLRNRSGGSATVKRKLGIECGTWTPHGTLKGTEHMDYFGTSIASSENGQIIAVGSHKGEETSGPVRSNVKVYSQSNNDGESTQIGNTITGIRGGGSDISLSSDGRTLAVANVANNNDGKVSTEVTVFTYHNGSNKWEQRGGKIEIYGAFYQLRSSVKLSHDGTTLVFAASGSGFLVYGKTLVFTYDRNGRWVQKGNTILEKPDSNQKFASVEISTSISSDADVIAVGASTKDNNEGIRSKVRVFKYNPDQKRWELKGHELFGSDDTDFFGVSLSLGSDGNSLAIGADGTRNNRGSAKVFFYSGIADEWVQTGNEIFGWSKNLYFGRSISFSSDSFRVLVGSINGSAVYQYDFAMGIWGQVGYTQTNTKGKARMFGASVILSDNGKKVILGAPMSNNHGRYVGSVYTYTLEQSSCEMALPYTNVPTFAVSSPSPSQVLTILPTSSPSQSSKPSVSSRPTSQPTPSPTRQHSSKPSDSPSEMPTALLSTGPSFSTAPSLSPKTSSPTSTPTTSSPTSPPSLSPSKNPTVSPSKSVSPSFSPTHPTIKPSSQPSGIPTESSSSAPSISSQPSLMPTETLSTSPSNSSRPSPIPTETLSSKPSTSSLPTIPIADSVYQLSNIQTEVSTSSAGNNASFCATLVGAISTVIILLV